MRRPSNLCPSQLGDRGRLYAMDRLGVIHSRLCFDRFSLTTKAHEAKAAAPVGVSIFHDYLTDTVSRLYGPLWLDTLLRESSHKSGILLATPHHWCAMEARYNLLASRTFSRQTSDEILPHEKFRHDELCRSSRKWEWKRRQEYHYLRRLRCQAAGKW